ncbi:hypothetical protein F2Q69_00032098 [Brassica cretica]|uniref:Uncharacterized protein n=1 Tax=Brassica cretica TaxID=69181 RepID=A0A8S9S1S7_BRACR|nr:hypothetical protein F2Q69_00032098 [Brassica cretica]
MDSTLRESGFEMRKDRKEVKGLEELLQHSPVYDISKLCRKSLRNKNIVVFWNFMSQGSESLEFWSAEISLEARKGHEVWGKIEWSGSVFKLGHLSHSYPGTALENNFMLGHNI